MKNVFHQVFKRMDQMFESHARNSARTMGRRHWLAKTGAFLVGAGLTPILPFDRSGATVYAAENPNNAAIDCTYWRLCAMDGALCSDSGASMTSCPAGSDISKVSWVGTCHNPEDGKDYLISYNDCCGKSMVKNATKCLNSKGERPGYRMGLHNDVNWCMGNEQKGYHCTVALIVGMADA